MEINLERLEGNLARLTVTVPAEEVDSAISDAYRDAATSLRIPGFRKGKAPRPMIDSHVGREAVLAQAQETIVERSYPKALDAEDLRPVGQPDIGELDLPVEGQDYTYAAEVELRPELELSSDEPVSVEMPPREATEAEVDAQLESMRERFGTIEPIEDRGAEKEDFVLVSFIGTAGGEPYEGNQVDKYLYEMSRGLMPEEFDDAILGAKPGDEVVAEFVIPEGSSRPELVGQTARFDITVHEIKAKVLPELDAEFAQSAGGFDSIDELREDIRKRLNDQRAMTYGQALEREARSVLAERLVGDVPEQMVEAANDSMTRDFFNSLESRGVSLRDYVAATNVDPEKIQSDIREQAERSTREELALEALFRAKGMQVTDEDLDASLADFAGESGDVEGLRERWRAAGVLPVVREQVMHRKAVEWLMDNLNIVEKDPAELGNKETPAADSEKPKAASGKKKASRKKKDAEATSGESADEASASGSEE